MQVVRGVVSTGRAERFVGEEVLSGSVSRLISRASRSAARAGFVGDTGEPEKRCFPRKLRFEPV